MWLMGPGGEWKEFVDPPTTKPNIRRDLFYEEHLAKRHITQGLAIKFRIISATGYSPATL